MQAQCLAPRDPKHPDLPLTALPKQAEFALCTSKNVLFAGGWGSSKSTALALGCYVSAVQNWGLTGVVVLPTLRMCLEFVNTQLVPMLSDFVVSHNKSEHTIYMPDGGRIVYASASDAESVRRIEQINAAWTAADEAGLMSRDIFVRLAARARDERAVKRRHMYAGTPIWGWLKDEFEGRDDEERRIIHASTRENPYLPEDYIANLQSSCPARLARAYIEGHFVPPGGSVYAEFDDTIHVVDWTHRSNLPTVASIDWSPRVPHILIAQMLPDGTEVSGRRLSRLIPGHEFAGLVVCDEIVLDGSKLAITREVLLSELLRRGYALDHFVCDPAGNAAQSSTTVTDIRRAVEMLGIQPRMPRGSASRSIQAGIAHVQNMLMPMDRVPRIYFARDMCDRARTYATHVKGRASINAIMAYGYPEDDTSAVPVKDGVSDHFCDCLRYLCVVHFVADRLLSTVRHTA